MFQKGNSISSLPVEIERQARIERSLARGACVRGVMHAFAHGLRVLRLRGIPLVRDLATKWVLRRAMRELHRLDDRTLADIGLTRGEIESAVRHGLPTRKLPEHNWDSRRSSGPPSPTSEGFPISIGKRTGHERYFRSVPTDSYAGQR